MSTKIYNGYRIRTLNAMEFNEFVLDLRKRLQVVLEDKYDKTFCMNAAHYIHELVILDNDYKESKNPEAIEKLLNELYKQCAMPIGRILTNYYLNKEEVSLEQMKKDLDMKYFGSIYELVELKIRNRCHRIAISQQRDNPYDFLSDLCVFPRDENYTLLLAYGDDFENMLMAICDSRKKVDKEFKKKYGLEYYGYWNNVDPPKNLTQKAWRKRHDDWDFLDGVPAMTGIPIEILSYDAFFDAISLGNFTGKKVVKGKYFRALDDIASLYAKSKVRDEFIKSHSDASEEDSVSKILKITDEFKKLFEAEDTELMESYKKWTEYYTSILPNVTMETTLNTVTSFLPNYLADYPVQK